MMLAECAMNSSSPKPDSKGIEEKQQHNYVCIFFLNKKF